MSIIANIIMMMMMIAMIIVTLIETITFNSSYDAAQKEGVA
jgi:hypothetical protein